MLIRSSGSLFTKIALKYSTTYNIASLESLLPTRKQHPSFFPVKILSHTGESSFLLLLGCLRDRGEGKESEEVDMGRRNHMGQHQQERENVYLISRSLIRKDELSINSPHSKIFKEKYTKLLSSTDFWRPNGC